MPRTVISFLIRAGITFFAFWWVLKSVDTQALVAALRSADLTWLALSIVVFFVSQFVCILRWSLLVPKHPAVTPPFLIRTFFIASFFNTILPTTVGGDVIRGYEMIKATGQWRESLASILMDRLLGVVGFLTFGLSAWIIFTPAREDPVLRMGFYGFCGIVAATFAILGSRQVLNKMLKPFSRIGLGQLESHAKQFQESLLNYLRHPQQLARAFGVSIGVQTLTIFMFAAVAKALNLPIPLLFMILVVPIVVTVAQLPISLNGWGIREGAVILILSRINIGSAEALSLSLIAAVIPLLSGLVGAALFLTQRRRKKRRSAAQEA